MRLKQNIVGLNVALASCGSVCKKNSEKLVCIQLPCEVVRSTDGVRQLHLDMSPP